MLRRVARELSAKVRVVIEPEEAAGVNGVPKHPPSIAPNGVGLADQTAQKIPGIDL
jgi:hypothetical protein